MRVGSKKEAWEKVDIIFPTDYIKDEVRSARAGFDVYMSTAVDRYAWISDLGNRLEVNLDNGDTINIWIEEEPTFKEAEFAAALEVIDNAVYDIDDKVNDKIAELTGIKEARNQLYAAFDKIAEIIKKQIPESKLLDLYNLK